MLAASLVKQQVSGLVRDPVSKKKVERNRRLLTSASGTYMCTYTYVTNTKIMYI